MVRHWTNFQKTHRNLYQRLECISIIAPSRGEATKSRVKMEPDSFYFKLSLNTEPIIDDTTLRDGIQMPGLAASSKDAAQIAQLLSQIGVERIEVFHYQESDKKAAKLIQALNLNIRVAGWCRAVKEDIDSAIQCGFCLLYTSDAADE